MKKVTLNEEELIHAGLTGVRRQASSLTRNYKDQHGANISKGWQLHVEGACGELAFAKAMNWFWNGSVNTFKLPDVGNVQIRTRSEDHYELIIRKTETGIFVLVTGIAPSYKVHGWFNALHVRDEWIKDYGGREKAYFVPQKELYPLETLEKQDNK